MQPWGHVGGGHLASVSEPCRRANAAEPPARAEPNQGGRLARAAEADSQPAGGLQGRRQHMIAELPGHSARATGGGGLRGLEERFAESWLLMLSSGFLDMLQWFEGSGSQRPPECVKLWARQVPGNAPVPSSCIRSAGLGNP